MRSSSCQRTQNLKTRIAPGPCGSDWSQGGSQGSEGEKENVVALVDTEEQKPLRVE
jgi:hypothetical protein